MFSFWAKPCSQDETKHDNFCIAQTPTQRFETATAKGKKIATDL